MKIDVLEEKIVYYRDVVSNPYELIEFIEETDQELGPGAPLSKWADWIAYQSEYSFGMQKKFIDASSIDDTLPNFKECFYIYKQLKTAIMSCADHYSSTITPDVGILAPLSISKYFEGKSMGPHVDAHDDDPTKTISCVLYLNDDYVGGDLNFPNHNISVKPEAGSLVIFPSKYMHESKPIISGTKYMAPGFWNKI